MIRSSYFVELKRQHNGISLYSFRGKENRKKKKKEETKKIYLRC